MIQSVSASSTSRSLEVPPRRELGDLAFPAALHLAQALKRKPREIAEELAAGLRRGGVVREGRVAGAGYLNLFLDRRRLRREPARTRRCRRRGAAAAR